MILTFGGAGLAITEIYPSKNQHQARSSVPAQQKNLSALNGFYR